MTVRTRALIQAFSLTLLLPAFSASAMAAADPAVYKVDPDHSGVNFTIRHFVSNVPGRFKDFDGVIKYDKQNPAASSVSFTVQTASIDTDNDDRDKHLRSPDFFDADRCPGTLRFDAHRERRSARRREGACARRHLRRPQLRGTA
jgi:polyisoprenoid-binding protein YceI